MPAFLLTTLLARCGLAALMAAGLFVPWAEAQSMGVGPRMAFVRGDLAADPASTTYTGGHLRLWTSDRVAFELALDHRTHLNDSLTERVRHYPFQASMLLFPVRAALAPYLLGGVGWYNQSIEQLDEEEVEAVKSRVFGYHAGVGGELRFHRRIGAFMDYRYTFIGFGEPESEDETGALPIPGTGSLQRQLRLIHKGSMWTSGVSVYF